jgi:clathrin heavy chain
LLCDTQVGRDKDAPGGVFRVAPQLIPLPPDAPNDFPVAMSVSTKHDVIYMITKQGYLFLFDVHTGKALYRAKISNETIFVTAPQGDTGGVVGITARTGSVLHIALNEATLIPYVVNTLRDNALAIELAGRLNFDGANELYEMQFNNLLGQGDIQVFTYACTQYVVYI